MTKQLISAMAFYVFYMFFLALMMLRSRITALRNKELPLKYFRTYSGAIPSERTLVWGRHFDNQFQVPVLFFVTCLTALLLGHVEAATLILAWLFIASRLWHSWIHLGSNRIQWRFAAYAAGWLFLLGLWIQILLSL